MIFGVFGGGYFFDTIFLYCCHFLCFSYLDLSVFVQVSVDGKFRDKWAGEHCGCCNDPPWSNCISEKLPKIHFTFWIFNKCKLENQFVFVYCVFVFVWHNVCVMMSMTKRKFGFVWFRASYKGDVTDARQTNDEQWKIELRSFSFGDFGNLRGLPLAAAWPNCISDKTAFGSQK